MSPMRTLLAVCLLLLAAPLSALAQAQRFVTVVNNYADLFAFNINFAHTNFFVCGRNAVNDGGQGEFTYSAQSTATTNMGTVFKPTGYNGRFLRQYNGSEVNVKWFGAQGDNLTDDRSAITNALAVADALYFPIGVYRTTASITNSAGRKQWRGEGFLKSYINFAPTVAGALLYLSPASDGYRFESIGFRNVLTAGTVATSGIVATNGGFYSDLWFNDVLFEQFTAYGLLVTNVGSLRIERSRFNNNQNITGYAGTGSGQAVALQVGPGAYDTDIHLSYFAGNDRTLIAPHGGGLRLVSNQFANNQQSGLGYTNTIDVGSTIMGSFLYMGNYAENNYGAFIGLGNVLGANLSANQWAGSAASVRLTTNHIYSYSTAVGTVVDGNAFEDVAVGGYFMQVASTASNIVARGNSFRQLNTPLVLLTDIQPYCTTNKVDIDWLAINGAPTMQRVSAGATSPWTIWDNGYLGQRFTLHGTNGNWVVRNETLGRDAITVMDTQARLGVFENEPNSTLHTTVSDAVTATNTSVLRLDHQTSGTAANGLGTSVHIDVERDDGTDGTAGIYGASWMSTPTPGVEDGYLWWAPTLNSSSSTHYMRLDSTGLRVGDSTAPTLRLEVVGSMDLNTTNAFVQMTEMAGLPAAPAANGARLYLVDNGAGKTSLRVIFNSGAAQTIATEP